jgi:signal transduction histidine kinase
VNSDTPTSDSEYVRTKFLGRIAHDLRGPAGVTLGALDEIERVLGPRADELRPLLQMANRGLRRILRSADRLDQTSSLEASRDDWKTTRCDLNVTLQQVVHEIQLTEGRDRVTVDHVSLGTPCTASLDVPWIRAALGEIVSNAIRFARTQVVIDAREDATEVSIVVSDDGPGFSGPVSPRFSRSTTRRGLGLSLPIVEDVIRGHGGRVHFRNRREEDPSQTGTSVTVTLPRGGAVVRGCP